MTSAGWVAAVDLGATSGRVMLGHVGPDQLSVEAVHRFSNDPVRVTDGLHWNILELYRNLLIGLRKAVVEQPDLAGVGIDSWAVDYGLVSGDRLINNPFHYRDERTARGVDLVHKIADHASLYATNGLQFQPFNSIYQLAVDQKAGVIDDTTRMLMLPDLLGFWLTGEQIGERTNASTTGLLDVSTGSWNTTLIDKLSLPRSLFPSLVDPASRVGSLRDDVAAEVGAALDVIAVGSHDTASAVVGVPMTEPGAAYISSGTWSLVGIELDRPVLTEESREANFTNEGGVDGKIRYLRNVMGMWLLSESIRTWEREGLTLELTTLLAQAAAITTPVTIFDANHPSLLPPGDMPKRIIELCVAAGTAAPSSPPEFARSIVESLAEAYATAIDDAERLSGSKINIVHIVGGGSQNTLLCQLTANRTGRRVLAGPVEATAIGNVLIQGRAAGLLDGELSELRALVARTFPLAEYSPQSMPVRG
ncbi:MAG TPA: rhamnulokinase family protein [Propionibacteriaceae bacterium]|nr:rhamnulokinase family protein [Propionibacteriaceae bacterium]